VINAILLMLPLYFYNL
jgi:Ca2+/H+ antiporter